MLCSKVAQRPSDTQLPTLSSPAPDVGALPAARRQLAAELVDELGSRAAPLLEAVLSCCSTIPGEGGDEVENDASLLLNQCPGRLLLRLRQFMSCGAWSRARAATGQALAQYRAFARSLREEAGGGRLQQLALLSSRLLSREILPQDFALCAARLLRAHPHLLPQLLQLLSLPVAASAPPASSFKRASRCAPLPPPWEDAARPLASSLPSASLTCSTAAAPQRSQLLTNTRSRVPSAARAIVAGDLYALGCSWGSMRLHLPPDAQLSAARSLSQFAVALNPN